MNFCLEVVWWESNSLCPECPCLFGINSQIVCLVFHFETNTRTEIMSKRFLRDCPIPNCGETYLVKLSNHLADVHELSSEDRKRWLQETKLQPKTYFHQSSDVKSNQYTKTNLSCDWLAL